MNVVLCVGSRSSPFGLTNYESIADERTTGSLHHGFSSPGPPSGLPTGPPTMPLARSFGGSTVGPPTIPLGGPPGGSSVGASTMPPTRPPTVQPYGPPSGLTGSAGGAWKPLPSTQPGVGPVAIRGQDTAADVGRLAANMQVTVTILTCMFATTCHYSSISSSYYYYYYYYTRLMASFSVQPGSAGSRKVKPIWILLKQETVSGSGFSWAICKSAPRSRQITITPPLKFFTGRVPFLPPTQQRQSTEGNWGSIRYEQKICYNAEIKN